MYTLYMALKANEKNLKHALTTSRTLSKACRVLIVLNHTHTKKQQVAVL